MKVRGAGQCFPSWEGGGGIIYAKGPGGLCGRLGGIHNCTVVWVVFQAN